MKALYFDATLELRDIPEPEPGPEEALIRVTIAGICRTDIEIVKGYMGFKGVPGHEFVGVVEKSPKPELNGKRVVGEINIPHGECEMCAAGMGRHCYDREVLGILGRDGVFTEKVCLPIENLFIVPEGMEDDAAVFTEPVAACCEILEQEPDIAGERVMIVGDGRLASLAAQVLNASGCEVMVVGKYDDKLKILEKEFGLKTANTENALGERFEYVVECSGRPSGLELATRCVKPRGTIILKSTYEEKPQMDMSLWVINEITVMGSRCGRFAPALEMLAAGKVNPLPLIEKTFPLERGVEAFEAASASGAKKVLIKI